MGFGVVIKSYLNKKMYINMLLKEVYLWKQLQRKIKLAI